MYIYCVIVSNRMPTVPGMNLVSQRLRRSSEMAFAVRNLINQFNTEHVSAW